MDLPPLSKYVALDCETVRTRSGHVLAKIGMVDHEGNALLKSFVYVHPGNVLNYNTEVNGIRPADLEGAPTFEQIQPTIKALIRDKILVGHALYNDLSYVQHRHPWEDFRDTQLYIPLRKMMDITQDGMYPSLKKLYKKVFDEDIQTGVHCPVEDTRATMRIFMHVREEYERSLLKGEEIISGIPRSFEKWFW